MPSLYFKSTQIRFLPQRKKAGNNKKYRRLPTNQIASAVLSRRSKAKPERPIPKFVISNS